MLWYVLFLMLSAYWLVTGTYLILWAVLTFLRHLLFGVPGDYRQ